jgi:E3 SUMO-protein ligase PIAS1
VDEVIVEADGEWHTEDSKYGSEKWIASRALARSQPASAKPSPSPASGHPVIAKQSPSAGLGDSKPEINGANGTSGSSKQREVFVLDEDDSDDDLPPRNAPIRSESTMADRLQSTSNLTPLSASISRQSPATTGGGDGVIDLTLDSDDDDSVPPILPPPPPPADLFTGPSANGSRAEQNGSNKRGRDWYDDTYSEDSEDFVYHARSPRPARNRVYDDEDNVPKRPRLSTSKQAGERSF